MRVKQNPPGPRGFRHLGAKLFSILPDHYAGQRQRCNGPADRASGRLHGCDLIAIQTIHKKMTSPMSAMKDTPTEYESARIMVPPP